MAEYSLDSEPKVLDLSTRKPIPEGFALLMPVTTYVQRPTCQDSPISNSDSEPGDLNSEPKVRKIKAPRPFKAYIKDRLALGDVYPNFQWPKDSSADTYNEFRDKVLSQARGDNSGTNKNMRRTPPGNHNRNEDPAYWEKRRKNNEAAKRSRDARRAKEDEIAIRCAYFERENMQLHYAVDRLTKEVENLRKVIYHVDFKKA